MQGTEAQPFKQLGGKSVGGERSRCNDRDRIVWELCHLVVDDVDIFAGVDLFGDISRKPFAVNGKRTARVNAGRVCGLHDQRAEGTKLLLEQSHGVA